MVCWHPGRPWCRVEYWRTSWRLQDAVFIVLGELPEGIAVSGPAYETVTSLHRFEGFLDAGQRVNGQPHPLVLLERQGLGRFEHAVFVDGLHGRGHGSAPREGR